MNGNAVVAADTPVATLSEQPPPHSLPTAYGHSGSIPLAAEGQGIFPSEKDAQTAFDTLRSDATYVWEYLEDGCLARAHKMCRFLTERGMISEKIRIENANGTWFCPFGLVVQPADAPHDPVHLRFHIAVVVRVQTPAGAAERIFDPSFFGGPVPQEVWATRFINADSISVNKQIDYDAQEKEYRRFAHDVFDTTLCWPNKDPEMKLTERTLASLQGLVPQNSRAYLTINALQLQKQG